MYAKKEIWVLLGQSFLMEDRTLRNQNVGESWEGKHESPRLACVLLRRESLVCWRE